ncbi:MAG: DUF1028 domain-containing protein [Myxococcales bacterium]|nr:DUF1028 domain-containing protein [Myxococcota bacterium]MDW8282596.1 DUF1028 domain-containing protein [Myxococcales bacterium]
MLAPVRAFSLSLPLLSGLAAAATPTSEATEHGPHPRRPVHTFSIVARDPQTGDLGVAVQSHWFAVGLNVPWAEAGVGAVATQSFTNPAYGLFGIDLMRSGKSAPETMRTLLGRDPDRELRQVAMVDSQGRVAAHTGTRCIQAAGHIQGPGYVVQANLMTDDKVWGAMARAYEAAQGDLAERMLLALEAGQAAGGDLRGRQSAALLVVSGKATGRPWIDRIFDLRVDDHPEPLKELRRLLTLQRAYRLMSEGDEALERRDHEAALRSYAAAEQLAPDNLEMVFWHAVALVNMGRTADAVPLFRRTFAGAPGWRTLVRRLPRAGLLPDDPAVMEQIISPAAAPPPRPPKR